MPPPSISRQPFAAASCRAEAVNVLVVTTAERLQPYIAIPATACCTASIASRIVPVPLGLDGESVAGELGYNVYALVAAGAGHVCLKADSTEEVGDVVLELNFTEGGQVCGR